MLGESLGDNGKEKSKSRNENENGIQTSAAKRNDQYLILLQQRNRAHNYFKAKDPVQVQLEHLEQGFTLYLNGANADMRKQHITQDLSRGVLETSKISDPSFAVRRHHTAPGKVQKKGWIQNSVNIKSESGSRVHIRPNLKCSERFKIASNDMDSHQTSEQQGLKEGLQKSLCLQCENFESYSDDSESIEEVLPGNETEEVDAPLVMQEDFNLGKEAVKPQICLAGDLFVLQFKDVGKNDVRALSAKRKDNTECHIPTKPIMVKNNKSFFKQPETIASGPGNQQERILSATRKDIAENKDSKDSASKVINAIQLENEAIKRSYAEQQIGSQLLARPPYVKKIAFLKIASPTGRPAPQHF